MAAFYGADTEQLREQASLVMNRSGRLDEIRSELASTVSGVAWTGPDADAFRDDFTSRVGGLFDSVTGLLPRKGDELEQHAEQQDSASDGTGGGSGGGAGDSFSDDLDDLLANPLVDVGQTLRSVYQGATGAWKGFLQGRSLMNLFNATRTAGAAADAAEVFLHNDMLRQAGATAGRFGRFLGGAGGLLSIGTGISDMISPPHDGWRGVGDRIAGGLGVVGGAGSLAVALGAGAALGPVGLGAVAVAGAGSALWSAGNAIWDNREAIGDFFGDVGGHVGDFVSDAGDVLSGAGEWVGGLFS